VLTSSDGPTSRIEALALRLHRTGKDWTVQNMCRPRRGWGWRRRPRSISRAAACRWRWPWAAAGAGLPHLVVGYLIKKRYTDFTTKFPDAIELLVRGLKSGLPIAETLNVVSAEVPGPWGRNSSW
jgi:tight adherence protein B